MATVVTVHGTFAHAGGGAAAPDSPPTSPQWWQEGSDFDKCLRSIVEAAPGPNGPQPLDVKRFEWSGENSEVERRQAGSRLYRTLKEIDAKGEPFCVVGHSHGGSVLTWALLESAAKKNELKNLKRWITVGTPFVNLKRERLLIQRLPLLFKVAFVASLMLLMMFLVYLISDTLDGGRMLFGNYFPPVLAVTGAMMSLPIIVFYIALKYLDARNHLHYRRRVKNRAKEYFAGRWQSFTHPDDEAVQGLAFLPGAKLYFFDKSFAVSTITLLSVVALPLLYIVLLKSPTPMIRIGDWLKHAVYDTSGHQEAEKALRDLRIRLRETRTRERAAPTQADSGAAFRAFRDERRQLAARYPNLKKAERALRFKGRFFEREGKPCEGGHICGAGRDFTINSGLLLHLVTDEISAALGGEGIDSQWQNAAAALAIPAIIVPVCFALLALGLMKLIQMFASLISRWTAHLLNVLTNAEVKRAAFGNDTEGEIAFAASDRPVWIDRSPPRLPSGIADSITNYSNGIAANSLAKFRRVIGQLASAEPKHTADTAITTYFTWKELVHSSYFDVAQFGKLVGQAVSRAEGFAPSQRFLADPDHARTAQWLAEIEGAAGTTATPASAPPTQQDAGAVAAAVASTVKAEP
jgi:hypothetical protein